MTYSNEYTYVIKIDIQEIHEEQTRKSFDEPTILKSPQVNSNIKDCGFWCGYCDRFWRQFLQDLEFVIGHLIKYNWLKWKRT